MTTDSIQNIAVPKAISIDIPPDTSVSLKINPNSVFTNSLTAENNDNNDLRLLDYDDYIEAMAENEYGKAESRSEKWQHITDYKLKLIANYLAKYDEARTAEDIYKEILENFKDKDAKKGLIQRYENVLKGIAHGMQAQGVKSKEEYFEKMSAENIEKDCYETAKKFVEKNAGKPRKTAGAAEFCENYERHEYEKKILELAIEKGITNENGEPVTSIDELKENKDYYNIQYEYLLNNKENLTAKQKEKLELLDGYRQEYGSLDNVDFGELGDGKEIEKMRKPGFLRKIVGEHRGKTEEQLENEAQIRHIKKNLKKLKTSESRVQYITKLLNNSKDEVMKAGLLKLFADLQKEGKIDADAVLNAEYASGVSDHIAMLNAQNGDDRLQMLTVEIVSEKIETGRTEFTNEQLVKVPGVVVDHYEKGIQAGCLIHLGETGNKNIAKGIGQALPRADEDVATEVYTYIVNPPEKSKFQDENLRGIVTREVHENLDEGSTKAQLFNQIDEQYNYNPYTGQYNPVDNSANTDTSTSYNGNSSNASTSNGSDGNYSYTENGYTNSYTNDYVTGNSDYTPDFVRIDKNYNENKGNFSNNEPELISNWYDEVLNNTLTDDVGNIIKQLAECSNQQERKELIKKLPEYVVLNLITANPGYIKYLQKGTSLYKAALSQLERASAGDVTIQAALPEIEKENGQVQKFCS